MARDGAECAPMRSAAQRAAGRQWAKWSADNAVRRLSGELGRTRARLEAAEQALGAVIGDDEVAHRPQAMLPALQATLGGWTPSWLERLRRNVALHAEAQGMDIVAASAAELRSAQRGPRLERRAAADGALRADAPPFVPLGPIGAGAPGGGVPHTPHDANQLLADLIAYAAPMQEALLGEGCQHAQTDGIDTELEAAYGGSGGPQLGGPQGAAAARARDLAELHDAFVEEVFVSANEAFGVQDDLNQLMADLAAELGGEADSRYAAAAEPGSGTGGFSPPKSQSQGRGEFEKPHDAEVNAAGIAELDALYAAAGGTALVHGSGARARGGVAQEATLSGGTAGTSEPIGLSEGAGGEVLPQAPEGTNSSVVAAEAVAEQGACADLSADDQRERHSEPSPTAPEKASGHGGRHRASSERSAAQRAAGRQWAKWSADNAVRRLTGELGRTRARLEAAEQALGAVIGDDEVAHRLQAMLPALQATLGGWAPSWLERLRRNVALHAEAQGVDIAAASAAELRSAQRGPRLERRAAADGALRADAPPFVPLGPIGAGAPGGGVPHAPRDASQLLADLIAYAAPMQEALLGEGCQRAQTDGVDAELEAADGGSGGPQLGGPQGAAAARARDLAELHGAFVEEVFVSANEAFGVQDDLNQLMADLAAELGGEADSRYAAAAEPGPGTGGFSPPKTQSQGRGEFVKPHDAEEGRLTAALQAKGHGQWCPKGCWGRGAAAGVRGARTAVVVADAAVAGRNAEPGPRQAGDLRERHSELSPTAPAKASGQWRSASDELRGATSALLMDLEAQLAAVWEPSDKRRAPLGDGSPAAAQPPQGPRHQQGRCGSWCAKYWPRFEQPKKQLRMQTAVELLWRLKESRRMFSKIPSDNFELLGLPANMSVAQQEQSVRSRIQEGGDSVSSEEMKPVNEIFLS
ncbi:unnamed protein product, partial [Prorocentrum cordatum]